MQTLPATTVLASLVQTHFDLAYAQAGFNIHDCSNSMHEVDEHEASIATLRSLVGALKKADVRALANAYARGYAKYAHEHNVFDEAPSKDINQADKLTPVSNYTDVDFDEQEGWKLFCDAYDEHVNASV